MDSRTGVAYNAKTCPTGESGHFTPRSAHVRRFQRPGRTAEGAARVSSFLTQGPTRKRDRLVPELQTTSSNTHLNPSFDPYESARKLCACFFATPHSASNNARPSLAGAPEPGLSGSSSLQTRRAPGTTSDPVVYIGLVQGDQRKRAQEEQCAKQSEFQAMGITIPPDRVTVRLSSRSRGRTRR